MTLIMTRLTAHFGLTTEEEFARAVGLKKSTWSNIKLTGGMRKSTAEIIAKNVPDLKVEFLMEGRTDGLPLRMLELLGLLSACKDCRRLTLLAEMLQDDDAPQSLDPGDSER